MEQKYYLFNFNGYTITVAMEGTDKENLKEKAKILAQAEAIKQGLDYNAFSSREITNIEFMVLTVHMRIGAV